MRNGSEKSEYIENKIDLPKQRIKVSLPEPIVEGSEDGAKILVELENGVFDSEIEHYTDYSIINLPNGVTSIGELRKLSDTMVELTLSGNSKVDYDEDLEDIIVEINVDGIQSPNFDEYALSEKIIFKAIVEPNEPELLIASKMLHESTSDDGSVDEFQIVRIANGVFTEKVASMTELYGSDVEGYKEKVTKISDTELRVDIEGTEKYHGPGDFVDLRLVINSGGIEGIDKPMATGSFGVEFIGSPRASISSHDLINEGEENGKKISVYLKSNVLQQNVENR